MLCMNCGEPVRGDVKKCKHCGEKQRPNEFTKGEQESEDFDVAGICELCERPYEVCDRDPCIESDSGTDDNMAANVRAEYVVGNPMPKSIGLCADLFAEVRTLRLDMQKIVDEVKARESEIRDHIINNLSKSDDTGAAGKHYRAQITVKNVPALRDWDALMAWIVKNGRYDLLHKRVSEKPVKDMWEEGIEVPGVEKFGAVDVSITKL